jgi:hypothetical protein
MHTNDGRVYHLDGRIMSGGNRVHDPVPYSGPSPPDETVVAGGCALLDIVELAGNVTRGTARNARYRTAACVDKRRLIRRSLLLSPLGLFDALE